MLKRIHEQCEENQSWLGTMSHLPIKRNTSRRKGAKPSRRAVYRVLPFRRLQELAARGQKIRGTGLVAVENNKMIEDLRRNQFRLENLKKLEPPQTRLPPKLRQWREELMQTLEKKFDGENSLSDESSQGGAGVSKWNAKSKAKHGQQATTDKNEERLIGPYDLIFEHFDEMTPSTKRGKSTSPKEQTTDNTTSNKNDSTPKTENKRQRLTATPKTSPIQVWPTPESEYSSNNKQTLNTTYTEEKNHETASELDIMECESSEDFITQAFSGQSVRKHLDMKNIERKKTNEEACEGLTYETHDTNNTKSSSETVHFGPKTKEDENENEESDTDEDKILKETQELEKKVMGMDMYNNGEKEGVETGFEDEEHGQEETEMSIISEGTNVSMGVYDDDKDAISGDETPPNAQMDTNTPANVPRTPEQCIFVGGSTPSQTDGSFTDMITSLSDALQPNPITQPNNESPIKAWKHRNEDLNQDANDTKEHEKSKSKGRTSTGQGEKSKEKLSWSDFTFDNSSSEEDVALS